MIDPNNLPPFTRRDALKRFATGLGMAGFATVAQQTAEAAGIAGNPWTPKPSHFAPRAKNVIVVFLQGGLSQIDSFDYKPMLEKFDGKPLPYETPRTEFATGNLMKSPFRFAKYGSLGIEVSELFPHMAKIIDEFCIVRSMISDIPNHGPSVLMMNTGSVRAGRPRWAPGLCTGSAPRTRIFRGSSFSAQALVEVVVVMGRLSCLPYIKGRWFPSTCPIRTSRSSTSRT